MTTLDESRRPGVRAAATPGRPPAEVLEHCRRTVEPALRTAVDTLPEIIRHLSGYHLGWWDCDGHPESGPAGKAVRPAMALLSAAASGGRGQDAVAGAVAVELVHNFSLLHDDVMDRDLTRRHRPTVWAVFGSGPAILAGDSLLTLAMDILAASAPDAPVDRLAAAVQELVDGQIDDLAFEGRADVRLEECLRMAEHKTGALLGGACAVGAACAGAPAERVDELDAFGRDVGVAFQLVDDLLGIWGDPARTGKPVRSDLRSRKKSLPVVAALTSSTEAGDELGELYRRERELSESELDRAAELVERSGARQWAGDRVAALTAGALDRLTGWDDDPRATAELRELACLLTRRDR